MSPHFIKIAALIFTLSLVTTPKISLAQQKLPELTIACSPSCPAPFRAMRQIRLVMLRQLQKLEQGLGVAILQNFKPIEVHPSYDDICRDIEKRYKVIPETAGFNHLMNNGTAIICLNTSPQNLLRGRSAFLHELSHLYLRIRRFKGEENPYEEILAMNFAACATQCDPKFPALAKRLTLKKKKGPLTNAIVKEEVERLGIKLP